MNLWRKAPNPFEGQGRMFLAYAWIVVLFVVGPTMASRLDDRGLPGARIVLVLIVMSACFVGYAVYTSLPRRRRARAVSRVAKSMGAPYQSSFTPPSTMHALPFLAMVPAANRSVFEGFECALDGRHVSMFTRSQAPDMYEPTIWRSCAATRVAIDAPMLRIERRGPAIAVDHRLAEHTFESESFNEIWRVRSSDGRFAEALVDQRMMAWLQGVDRLEAFEVGGGWAMAEQADGDLGELIGSLETFVGHIPRVVESLYPAAPQHAPPRADHFPTDR